MTTEFILPDIGEGIVECELLEWLVAEGDVIEEDQPVAEVMTDKATVQIPAMHAGTVMKLHYQPGDIAKVHAPLFAMATSEQVTKQEPEAESAVTQNHPASTSNTGIASAGAGEDFLLPDIGEGIVECEIVKWQVTEGQSVEEDQVVVEVMTDKAVVEIPAKHAGVITKLYYGEGDIAKVHAPLFALDHSDSAGTSSQSGPAHTQAEASASQTATPEAATSESAAREGSFEPPVAIPGKVLASPAVRRIAREHNIDLKSVQASGKKGRVLKQDVYRAAESLNANNELNDGSKQTKTASEDTRRPVESGGKRTEKVRGLQAAMAKQMQLSVQTIPHFTVSDELVMDKLIALRAELKPAFEAKGVKLSFMPFFIKALSLALKEFPVINSQMSDDGEYLHYFDDHNVGFAVDSKIGLLVPNIKRVQDLSLFDIASQMQTIIEQAREGKVPASALKGGTVSVSNIGALGGITATPVINKPEAAIVALGKTQKLPRFDDNGNVTAQHIMHVNWSGDHRSIDGATMVKFNNLWCHYLQNPSAMLMHLA